MCYICVYAPFSLFASVSYVYMHSLKVSTEAQKSGIVNPANARGTLGLYKSLSVRLMKFTNAKVRFFYEL